MIATATDYDSWRVGEEPVTVAEVIKTLKANADASRKVAAALIEDVSDALLRGNVITDGEGSMRYAVITHGDAQTEEDKKKLSYILPYFS